MKKFQKKALLTLMAVLVSASLAVSASAAYVTPGSTGSSGTCPSGYGISGSSCTGSFDLNGLLGSACPTQSGNNTFGNASASDGSTRNNGTVKSIIAELQGACTGGSCQKANDTSNCYNGSCANSSVCTGGTCTQNACTSGACSGTTSQSTTKTDSNAVSADTSTASSVSSAADTVAAISGKVSGVSITGKNCKDSTLLNRFLEQCGLSDYIPTANANTGANTSSGDVTSSGSTASPSPSTGATVTNGTAADNLSFEEQVVSLVNAQRAANGLSALKLSTALSNAARAKSQDMHDLNYFSHTSPTYGSPFDMLKSFGISYSTAGENIAMGYATPEAVVNGWMNSPGHRANILNASFTQIGVGYVADGSYWTQEFIG